MYLETVKISALIASGRVSRSPTVKSTRSGNTAPAFSSADILADFGKIDDDMTMACINDLMRGGKRR